MVVAFKGILNGAIHAAIYFKRPSASNARIALRDIGPRQPSMIPGLLPV
ncbi:hypothetical protein K3759_19600 (plasmid) [Sulfitobacter sp. W027]|nr:hypothetical protein [Sulfitobacter sp. W027]UWR35617.1 hypothetical protein K3759_19600 [Sulfitobacter sp. W027]